ncbi:unnamed protein product [Fraxinus pennsylvanica]|uniref:Uncharacterized protein n=1 Tax=Fraxinus pennsylvanica TaxID=56036 RepID=A0AAD1ZKG5_9LAMI|nr:unnamed protein product [Fraxinus pennsylvanica]
MKLVSAMKDEIPHCSSLRVPEIRTIFGVVGMLKLSAVDCDTGFKSYVASMKIIPAADSDGVWQMEWQFEMDPIVGWRLEDLVPKYGIGLQLMVKKMEVSISDSS